MKQPLNCELHYYQEFIPPAEARKLYAELHALVSAMRYQPQLADGSSQQLDFGKLMFLDQELLDSNRFPQEYWGPSLPWTENLTSLRKRFGSTSRSCHHSGEACKRLFLSLISKHQVTHAVLRREKVNVQS